MATPCLFCGAQGPGVLTNEHVTPRWLLEHLRLPKEDKLFQGVASSVTGKLVESPRVHSSFSFVQGRVCEACNTGWMSRLEGAARPLVAGLVDERRSVSFLSDQEAALVGKWAAKTAYLHTWAGPLKQPVQIEHLRELHGDLGQPGRGVGVFAMQAEYKKPSGYIQSGSWLQFGAAAAAASTETPAEAYKVGLQYRRLYLLVAFWPDAASRFVRLQNMHVRLVPRGASPDAEYSTGLMIGDGPIDRLAAFTDSLAVRHTGG